MSEKNLNTETVEVDYFSKLIPLVNCLNTYQGEGPNCGKKMVLVRYKLCNLLCPFCDTQKTTCGIKDEFYSLKDIDTLLQKSPNLMITGGEPTLDKVVSGGSLTQFDCTVLMLRNLNYEFLDIETNGFNLIPLMDQICDFERWNMINVSWSPKFIKSEHFVENVNKLQSLVSNGYEKMPVLKIVIGDDMDVYKKFAYEAVLKYKYNPNNIYLMPKGTTYEEIQYSMKQVLTIADELSCNVSSRLHILHDFK